MPTEAPLEKGVDFNSLGEKFDISGGSIKSAVFRAAVQACRPQHPPSTTCHLPPAAACLPRSLVSYSLQLAACRPPPPRHLLPPHFPTDTSYLHPHLQASLEDDVMKRLITMAGLLASGKEEMDKEIDGKRIASMYT